MLASKRIGLVANEKDAWPSGPEVTALRPAWIRSIVYDLDRFEQRLADLPADVGVIALLNSEAQLVAPGAGTVGLESAADWEQRWSSLIEAFVERFGDDKAGRPIVVECLNEWDTPDVNIDVNKVIRSVQLAAPPLKAAGVRVLLSSVASGNWPAKLQDLIDKLPDADRANLDGACFHPYLKPVSDGAGGVVPTAWAGLQTLTEGVQQAYEILNPEGVAKSLPLWLTEFGLNRTDVASDAAIQATYVTRAFVDLGDLPDGMVEVACLFCWDDRIGKPGEEFGLRPAAGDPAYPAWQAFKDCAAAVVAPAAAEVAQPIV